MECFSVKAVIVFEDPVRLEECLKLLKDLVCRRLNCAGRAFWFLAASDDCLVEVGGETYTPVERAYMARYEVPLEVVCKGPRQLVDAMGMLISKVEECKGVRLSVKASR